MGVSSPQGDTALRCFPGFLSLAAFGIGLRDRGDPRTAPGLDLLDPAHLGHRRDSSPLPSFDEAKARGPITPYQVGQRQLEANRIDAALQSLWRKRWRPIPSSGKAWHGRGRGRSCGKENLQAAVQAYETATQLLPSSVLTWYNLGSVYGRLGRRRHGPARPSNARLQLTPGHVESSVQPRRGPGQKNGGTAERGPRRGWNRGVTDLSGTSGSKERAAGAARESMT